MLGGVQTNMTNKYDIDVFAEILHYVFVFLWFRFIFIIFFFLIFFIIISGLRFLAFLRFFCIFCFLAFLRFFYLIFFCCRLYNLFLWYYITNLERSESKIKSTNPGSPFRYQPTKIKKLQSGDLWVREYYKISARGLNIFSSLAEMIENELSRSDGEQNDCLVCLLLSGNIFKVI